MFRSVSPSFANRVSQVSQMRVSQGFANASFAVLRLFRKIRKVSQIRVFASFRKYKFRKLSQIGFSFRKLSQVSQGFRNWQFADGQPASRRGASLHDHDSLGDRGNSGYGCDRPSHAASDSDLS